MLANAIAETAASFSDVEMVAVRATDAINNIRRNTSEIIGNAVRGFRTSDRSLRRNERACVTLFARAGKRSRLFVGR